MIAIEVAHKKGWHKIWLECDSMLVVMAFNSPNLVPWQLRNIWRNCLLLFSHMQFIDSHIYREGNTCADKLANFGVNSHCSTWWDLITDFIRIDFFRNRFSLPNYRFL